MRRGRGVAVAIKAVISPTTSVANVIIAADGSTTLYCGTVDMGQGSDTAMAQMVGEVLNIPAESVKVVQRDTDVTPYDMGTLGSRSLFHMGHAVRLRGRGGARQDQGAGARGRRARRQQHPARPSCSRRNTACRPATSSGTGIYKPDYVPPDPATGLTPNATPFWMCAAAGAEVEVDTETGQVRITRLINVVDCGKPVNPKIVETQISGASLMQLGFTMFEKMHIDAGQVTNASLADYKIPGILDVPVVMENEAVERPSVERPVRRQGRGRDRDLLRVARDRQRHRGCLRRPPDRASAQSPRPCSARCAPRPTSRSGTKNDAAPSASPSTASRSRPRSSRITISSSCCSATST